MGPAAAIKTGFAKSFQFRGRTSRSEFWWFSGFVLVIIGIVIWLDYALFTAKAYSGENASLIMLRTNHDLARLIGPLLLVPLSAVCVRRLFATGKTWFWILPPVAASLVFFYMLWTGLVSAGRGVIDMRQPQSWTVTPTLRAYAYCAIATLLPAIFPFWHYLQPSRQQPATNEVTP